MRDFFIRSLEMVINVIVVIAALGILGAAVAAAAGGPAMMGHDGGPGGPLLGLMILVGGTLYLILVAGFMYLGLGIYQNTRRMAEEMAKANAGGR